MRHRSSTLVWLGPLTWLVSVAVSRVEAAEPSAPSCRNAGVTVSFVRGSMDIDTNGRGALAGVAAWLANDDQRTARLEGYADRTGGATGNQRLSERRAQAAKDFLVTRGIEPDRIMVFGHGEATDRPLPAGSDGRVVLVTVCEVPKEAAAETPPPPQPQTTATPDVPPAPAPVPAAPPAPVPPEYAPIADIPPATSPSSQRPPSRIGIEATLGAGAIGFIDETARNATQTGAAWDARLMFGSRLPIAIEGAYVGSVQNIEALGLGTSSLLLGNGVEGTLRVNLSRARVQPYLFGGVGWTRYQLTNAQSNTSSLLGSDDVGTVPLGGGLSARLGTAFILDVRGTYRATFGGDMFQGVALNTDSSNAMQTWSAAGRIGFEF
jgi:hypothetical protein